MEILLTMTHFFSLLNTLTFRTGVPVAKMNGTVRGQTEEKESLDESEDDKDRRFASTDTGRTNLVSGKSSNPS